MSAVVESVFDQGTGEVPWGFHSMATSPGCSKDLMGKLSQLEDHISRLIREVSLKL